ncbi:MAG TPA: hypothetical protein VK856_14025 [Anaerolineaceae bacterium]|nr:hypothetical protein [Anaerolineaceae bacterium]
MKRGLLILMFGLILVAAWFRWFDEMDPEMVKAEFQNQVMVFKEKMADFSLKQEISKVVTVLDTFFSPADAIENENYVFEYNSTETLPEVVLQEPQTFYATEEEIAFATEELVVESTVEPTDEVGEAELAVPMDAGYPAPMMVPVTIVEPTQQVVETQEEIQSTDPVVASSSTMHFNQLQQSVPGSFLPYNLQSVDPLYTTNFAHTEVGCNWMGVAGQIFDENQQPINGMVVVVEGVTNNSMIELLGYSGLAEAYGPGGYELVIGEVNGPGIFWIQLFGEDGKPLSEIYSFQMNGTCEQNLAVINFTVKTDVVSKFVPTVNP